ERWARDFLRTLQHFYAKSVYFPSVFDKVREAVEQEEEHFLPFCLTLPAVIKEGLDIPQEFLLQSRTGVTGKGTSLLLSLARDLGASEVLLPYVSRKAVDWKDFEDAGIRVKFLRYEPLPYPQFWGAFVPRLSALDLLLCLGRDGRRLLEKASREVVV
ncbi:MAG: WbqC family protein, partial [Candidatus Aminicenantales bacterium]